MRTTENHKFWKDFHIWHLGCGCSDPKWVICIIAFTFPQTLSLSRSRHKCCNQMELIQASSGSIVMHAGNWHWHLLLYAAMHTHSTCSQQCIYFIIVRALPVVCSQLEFVCSFVVHKNKHRSFGLMQSNRALFTTMLHSFHVRRDLWNTICAVNRIWMGLWERQLVHEHEHMHSTHYFLHCMHNE